MPGLVRKIKRFLGERDVLNVTRELSLLGVAAVLNWSAESVSHTLEGCVWMAEGDMEVELVLVLHPAFVKRHFTRPRIIR